MGHSHGAPPPLQHPWPAPDPGLGPAASRPAFAAPAQPPPRLRRTGGTLHLGPLLARLSWAAQAAGPLCVHRVPPACHRFSRLARGPPGLYCVCVCVIPDADPTGVRWLWVTRWVGLTAADRSKETRRAGSMDGAIAPTFSMPHHPVACMPETEHNCFRTAKPVTSAQPQRGSPLARQCRLSDHAQLAGRPPGPGCRLYNHQIIPAVLKC